MAGKTLAKFDPNELENFRSIEDANAYFVSLGVNVNDNDADGIRSIKVVEDKDTLVGVPFLILEWRFNEGDYGSFVSAEVMLKDGTLYVINDGSTGIFTDLAKLTARREATEHPTPTAGRFVANGLSKSEFWFNADTKETKTNRPDGPGWAPAATYYLSY